MFTRIVFVVICILCLPFVSTAQEAGPVIVDEMVFCAEIKDRTPVDIQTNFPDSVGRVFCFTRILTEKAPTVISHVWYYNDTQMAIVDLPVKSSSWRTWSSKCVIRDWTGVWRVDVISSNGSVICSDEFMIRPDPEVSG